MTAPAPDPLPRPEDVASLDGLIRAFYEVVSGPAGERVDLARDRTLHRAGARVGFPQGTPEGDRLVMMDLEEYHRRFDAPRSAAFYEVELHRIVERFGTIAHVWSSYAYSDWPGGPVAQRGINSIQCHFDGARWWILGWIYDKERDGNPIPPAYLRHGQP
jgi:hypothetical protein